MSILIWLFSVFFFIHSESRILDLSRQENVTISDVDINDLFVQIYTRANPIGDRVNLTDGSNVASLSSFDINLETFIYIHGWEDTISLPASTLIKNSLLVATDANVLLLSWDKCADNANYAVSWGCVGGTGSFLGEFLKAIRKSYGYSLDNVTIIGHSLGAHIAGFTGKNTGAAVGVIVGLDPASPLFFEGDKNHRLNERDAKYVQAIHTCATGVVGVTYSVGISDFWPNGGSHQPGCGLDVFKCPHLRAIDYYAESLLSDGFVGQNCNSYLDYELGRCGDATKSVMGGLNVNKEANGSYYLNTNDKPPYAKGDV
ncbi:unnamed protein product [Ceutorhynchus assimilis]|uniref:Lipase domain-containing protein n=1 Tax=Ceutorhynchus assimilis TaxID=467358 RepID=A0A9N9MGZ3_9CUCU|nr:unnamed protein product [Ceutorhynchus assimilis]